MTKINLTDTIRIYHDNHASNKWLSRGLFPYFAFKTDDILKFGVFAFYSNTGFSGDINDASEYLDAPLLYLRGTAHDTSVVITGDSKADLQHILGISDPAKFALKNSVSTAYNLNNYLALDCFHVKKILHYSVKIDILRLTYGRTHERYTEYVEVFERECEISMKLERNRKTPYLVSKNQIL